MKLRVVSFFIDKYSKIISLKCFYCIFIYKFILGSIEN